MTLLSREGLKVVTQRILLSLFSPQDVSSTDQFIDLIGQFQPLASLSHGMEFTGINPALRSIIRYWVELMVAKTVKYKSPYAISSSYHPFISVLRFNPTRSIQWPVQLFIS